VTRKRRLLWLYGISTAVVLLAIALAAPSLLSPHDGPDRVGDLVVGLTDDLAAVPPPDAPTPLFTASRLPFRHFPGTRTHRLPEDMGSGFAVADLDGDGLPDLFFANAGPMGAPSPPCEVWRNLGGMRFERVDTPLPSLMGMGVAAGDIEGDGDIDLFVTGYGGNALLVNEGGMRFADDTEEAGLRDGGFAAGAAWGDLDADGDLDLYVTRYVEFDESLPATPSRRGTLALPATLNPSAFPPVENRLYLNDGARFREVARERGVANAAGKSLGALLADLDGDGLQDIYVANDVSDNALYLGRREGPFHDATYPSCTSDWRGAMGLAAGDPDRDGDLDLFITHWQTEENTLFVQEEDFVFRDASLSTYLGPPGRGRVGWATDFADFDADGRPDLLVANGSTFERSDDATRLIAQPLQLFWNGGERFFDLAGRVPAMAEALAARGGVAADLDGDADIDWIVGVHGESPLLLRNDTPQGNHLLVEARGSAPNPFALGARVTVEIGGARQVASVGSQVSYLCTGPTLLHFGLGKAEKADRVTVRFPSGAVVERRDVPAGTRLVVREVDPRSLGPLMDRAGDAMDGGRTDEARAILSDVLRRDPEHAGALYRMALLSEPREALALLDRLARADPVSARGWLLRAQILSDPRRPGPDLDAALSAIGKARALNPDETGVALEEGRLRLRRGEPAAAAAILEAVDHNPRAAALAALAHLRAGNPGAAARLLGRPAGGALAVEEEGDTKAHRRGDRDLLARLLDFGRDERWTLRLLAADEAAGAGALEDATRPAPVSFEEAARWALAPPDRTSGPPPGTTGVARGDLDGDGDEDLVAACGGNDPATALPWWALRRDGEDFLPIRGSLPEPGFRALSIGVADLDADGRAEVLLRDETGRTWAASLEAGP
jgi:hypothetical protein